MVVAGMKFCRSSWFLKFKPSISDSSKAVIEIAVSWIEAVRFSAVTITSSIPWNSSSSAEKTGKARPIAISKYRNFFMVLPKKLQNRSKSSQKTAFCTYIHIGSYTYRLID